MDILTPVYKYFWHVYRLKYIMQTGYGLIPFNGPECCPCTEKLKTFIKTPFFSVGCYGRK